MQRELLDFTPSVKAFDLFVHFCRQYRFIVSYIENIHELYVRRIVVSTLHLNTVFRVRNAMSFHIVRKRFLYKSFSVIFSSMLESICDEFRN